MKSVITLLTLMTALSGSVAFADYSISEQEIQIYRRGISELNSNLVKLTSAEVRPVVQEQRNRIEVENVKSLGNLVREVFSDFSSADLVEQARQADVGLEPVVVRLEVTQKVDHPEIATGFKASVGVLRDSKIVWNLAPEIFALPDGVVIPIILSNSDLITQVSNVRFESQNSAYYFGYRLYFSANKRLSDIVAENSKNSLENCLGGQSGLRAFFNADNSKFNGFAVDSQIGSQVEARVKFDQSVKGSFKDYFATGAKPGACEGAVRFLQGLQTLVAYLNGYRVSDLPMYLTK